MNPYRIVLADDHTMFRQAIKSILEEERGFEIAGEAGHGLQLLDVLRQTIPDMVILDIFMPNLSIVEAIPETKNIAPDVKVLILSVHRGKENVYDAISAGAHGYLLKQDADRELFAAIETIRQGRKYISPILCCELADELTRVYHKGPLKSPSGSLTRRQRQVLKLVGEGVTNKEIAVVLGISVRTVEHHRANIMRKLNIRQTAKLIKYAIRNGYTLPTK